MKKIKRMAALLLAAALSASVSMTAIAAEYIYIDKVDIDVIHDIAIDEYDCDVDVKVGSNRYEVESVKVTNEPDDVWEDGDKPKVTVVLWVSDEEGYRFASGIKKTDITLAENDGKITSVSRGDSGRKLTVKVELPKLQREAGFYEEALMVTGAVLDEASGIGYWDENEYADRYEVKIYRNNAYVGGIFKTSNLDYNFSAYFTRKGDYYFTVRGVRDKSGSSSAYRSDWADSEELYVTSDEASDIRLYGGYSDSHTSSGTSSSKGSSSSGSSGNGPNSSKNSNSSADKIQPSAGGWLKNANGWWWCNPDRTYPANAWKEINGAWYYFDQNGYCMMNSWIKSQESGLWYYCGESGAMVTNVWVVSNGKYYYCGPDGAMWTSRRTPDGYYVDANGAWIQ